tara:strand:+ start:2583 stop:3242 length:660 start_codon:yes stop_codon:yes gene_type:complete
MYNYRFDTFSPDMHKYSFPNELSLQLFKVFRDAIQVTEEEYAQDNKNLAQEHANAANLNSGHTDHFIWAKAREQWIKKRVGSFVTRLRTRVIETIVVSSYNVKREHKNYIISSLCDTENWEDVGVRKRETEFKSFSGYRDMHNQTSREIRHLADLARRDYETSEKVEAHNVITSLSNSISDAQAATEYAKKVNEGAATILSDLTRMAESLENPNMSNKE